MEDKDALYARWLSGEISDEQLKAAAGPDALTELDRVIKTLDHMSMPKYNIESGYKKIQREQVSEPIKKLKINWYLISIIIAVLVLLMIFKNSIFNIHDEIILAENGQNIKTELSDGSKLWLNDGSSVEYNSKNWAQQRTIKLTGEASFDVTKGSAFVVNTKHGNIKVLGTSFNVRSWGDNLYVECYEGKVQVIVDNQSTTLIANEAVNVINSRMEQKQNITSSAPAWQNEIARFYNEKLQFVFDELERQYNITVNHQELNRSFSGNFQHDDLNSALRSICKPMGLSYSISEDQKVVMIE